MKTRVLKGADGLYYPQQFHPGNIVAFVVLFTILPVGWLLLPFAFWAYVVEGEPLFNPFWDDLSYGKKDVEEALEVIAIHTQKRVKERAERYVVWESKRN